MYIDDVQTPGMLLASLLYQVSYWAPPLRLSQHSFTSGGVPPQPRAAGLGRRAPRTRRGERPIAFWPRAQGGLFLELRCYPSQRKRDPRHLSWLDQESEWRSGDCSWTPSSPLHQGTEQTEEASWSGYPSSSSFRRHEEQFWVSGDQQAVLAESFISET